MYQRNTGQAIKDVQRRVGHPVVKWTAATPTGWLMRPAPCSRPVHAAVVVFRGVAAAKYIRSFSITRG